MLPTRYASRRSLRFELSLGLAALVSLGILVVGSLLYQHQRYALEMYVGMSLQNVAQTAASFVNAGDYRHARASGSPASGRLQEILDGVRSANPLTVDVYTLEPRGGGGMQFGLAAAGGSRPPGSSYSPGEATEPVLQRVLQEGRSGYSRMYLDERGHCLSAFAPIRDASGVPVAVLGVDYAANVLWDELSMFRWRILGFSLRGALVALTAGAWYARRITRPLIRMAVQAREVAEGDFSKEIVERHGGTIRVETAPEGGARIVVSVPVLPAPQPESPVSAAPARA